MTISFHQNFKNQLLINPKLSPTEKDILHDLQKYFENKFDQENYFLIPSSGSSKKADESPKLVALHLNSILHSADRFNQYFKVRKDHIWGLVLPEFHVAGLSILARAFLSGSAVHKATWQPEKIQTWLIEKKINFTSLVPTQVYDLAQLKIAAPDHLIQVFVGAGQLNETLKNTFLSLGWPLIETYGMTETCSMIAIKNDDSDYQILPGIEVQTKNNLLQIKCNSLARAIIQKINSQYIMQQIEPHDWFSTEDQVEIKKKGSVRRLKFKGRSYDYIKIFGEGVSLPELREKLDQVALQLNCQPSAIYLLAIANSRSENSLVIAVDKSVFKSTQEAILQQFNSLVRPYEKIQELVQIEELPRTELGKVKIEELKNLVLNELNRRIDDKKI